MLVDAKAVTRNTTLRTDICIIGGGAAGITLAREFIGSRFEVVIVESGGLEFDATTQMLYEGECVGMPYPMEASRVRVFGGTTYHWSGACRPLDEMDFQVRPWVPYSGWPFDKDHLAPFYRRAHEVCWLGPYEYAPEYWATPPQKPVLPFDREVFHTSMFQNSPPSRWFGEVYRQEIAQAPNVTTLLHGNVTEIETSPAGTVTKQVRIETLDGNAFWMSARAFVLACGGIENPRLLLLSNTHQKEGIGNRNDLVGRFFMEHPGFMSGMFLPSAKFIPWLYLWHEEEGQRVFGTLSPSSEVQQREELLNICGRPYKRLAPSRVGDGLKSLRYLRDRLAEGTFPEDFWSHVLDIITDVDDIVERAYEKLKEPHRVPPGIQFVFGMQSEQTPNPDSRVRLGDSRDALGLRKAVLDWRLVDNDKRTIRRFQELLAQSVGRLGLGRLQIEIDDDDSAWTNPSGLPHDRRPLFSEHHMGTTRMHQDPRRGVVDQDCKVHENENLFVAGSSVFPTGGFANPTLTIVALALRLAGHLKVRYGDI